MAKKHADERARVAAERVESRRRAAGEQEKLFKIVRERRLRDEQRNADYEKCAAAEEVRYYKEHKRTTGSHDQREHLAFEQRFRVAAADTCSKPLGMSGTRRERHTRRMPHTPTVNRCPL